MAKANDEITTSQAVLLISNFMLGVGCLTLPRTVTEKVKTPDVWITVLIAGFLLILIGLIMAKLSIKYPGRTFFHFSQEIVGKWLGKTFGFVFVLCFLFLSCFEIRAMAEVAKILLLEETPLWAIIIPFMWVSIYLITKGINPIARFFEFIFPISIITFLVVLLMGLSLFEIDHLRPILGSGFLPVIKGLQAVFLSMTGFEIILIIPSFMAHPKKAVKAIVIGMIIPIVFYWILVVIVIGGLSVEGVTTRTWPTITLVRSYEFQGILFERFESILLVIWILQLFSTYSISYYCCSLGLSQVLNKDYEKIIYALLPIIYVICMLPKNINELFTLGDLISKILIIFSVIIPPLLLIISNLRRGKKIESLS